MTFKKTTIADLFIIESKQYFDNRGYFTIKFNDEINKSGLIQPFNLVQANHSVSKKSVIRGLHYQYPSYSQTKIVNVIHGRAFVVALDIRFDSATFGRYLTFDLCGDDDLMVYIPRGFAHGFSSLCENTIYQYYVDNIYSPNHEGGIRFDGPTLSINWMVEDPIVSDKDKNLGFFNAITKYSKSQYEFSSRG